MADDDDDSSQLGRQLISACQRGNISLLKRLIADHGEKLDPNPVDGTGNGPLHYAALGDHQEIAQLLFTTFPETIDPDIQNLMGDTAVHRAVEKDHLEFLKFLIENDADFTIKNNRGLNPNALAKSNEAREILRSANLAYQVNSAAYLQSESDDTGGESSTAKPLPIVKAELDPSMIAEPDDNDD